MECTESGHGLCTSSRAYWKSRKKVRSEPSFRGTAITLVTQYDVKRVLSIEELIGTKLEEIKFNEEKVLTDMTDITKKMKKIKIVT